MAYYISGTNGNDNLHGTMSHGVPGPDIYDDYIDAGMGNDTLSGLGGNDTLNGGQGSDILVGGAGYDTIMGGADNDFYSINSVYDLNDTLIEYDGQGIDNVATAVDYTLPAFFENLTAYGIFGPMGRIRLTGNSLDNNLYGNLEDNRLDGAVGADTMTGLSGDDDYYIDNVGDLVYENLNGGHDDVLTMVSLMLAPNCEDVSALGSANIYLMGNDLDNDIDGNSGNNILNGYGGNDHISSRGGSDTMAGGAGDDVYDVDSAGDIVSELANLGTDEVNTTISYTLTKNIEIGDLGGTGNGRTLTGNSLDNTLYGSLGNDILDGSTGKDILNAGSGNDTYVVDNVGDKIQGENSASGVELVQTSLASYSLCVFLENAVLIGTKAGSLSGNAGDNILTGNIADNGLTGGAGNDTLSGGDGTDVLKGEGGIDMLTGGAGHDYFVFEAAVNPKGADMITDFSAREDTIMIGNAGVFGAVGSEGKLKAVAFQLGRAADDAGDRIIYDKASGTLYFDADGNGAGAQIKIAEFKNKVSLSAADFLIV